MADKIATRAAYGKTLVKLGETDKDLIVMDADLSKSTMTAEFAKAYPERFFNMGIAEQNLYGTAAGLAQQLGKKNKVQGEFVLIIDRPSVPEREEEDEPNPYF